MDGGNYEEIDDLFVQSESFFKKLRIQENKGAIEPDQDTMKKLKKILNKIKYQVSIIENATAKAEFMQKYNESKKLMEKYQNRGRMPEERQQIEVSGLIQRDEDNQDVMIELGDLNRSNNLGDESANILDISDISISQKRKLPHEDKSNGLTVKGRKGRRRRQLEGNQVNEKEEEEKVEEIDLEQASLQQIERGGVHL